MLFTFNLTLYVAMAVAGIGSLLTLSTDPHWFIRAWDFPRVQIIAVCWIVAICFLAVNLATHQSTKVAGTGMVTAAILISAWHLFRILPYTPLMAPQAKAFVSDPKGGDDEALRILVSNVRQENRSHDLWQRVIRKADADVMIVAEVNKRWRQTLELLIDDYPHQVVYPQDNWYGLALLSRLPIKESEIRFLVQSDVPSIDAIVRLESGCEVRVVAVHPRPPEPIRDNDATARDAELALWGRELAQEKRPVVIGGDLNDVAWSQSTRLFLRLSQLLDPRRGRGLYNSFHADRIWMRFPLDHVFHSDHFTIGSLKRLPHVGSDHFPIFIELHHQPVRRFEHDPLEPKESDNEQAERRIERADNGETDSST